MSQQKMENFAVPIGKPIEAASVYDHLDGMTVDTLEFLTKLESKLYPVLDKSRGQSLTDSMEYPSDRHIDTLVNRVSETNTRLMNIIDALQL